MESYHEHSVFEENGIIYPFKADNQIMKGPNNVVSSHYHDYIELLYCLEGRYLVILDGNRYTLNKGDFIVINSMEIHSTKSLGSAQNKYTVIRFKPELLYTAAHTIFEMNYVLPFTMQTSTPQKLFSSAELSGTIIPSLIKNVVQENNSKSYGYELAIRTHLAEIFLWILRFWHSKGLHLNIDSGLNHETILRLEAVFAYIDKNYMNSVSIDDMMKICNMSYSYFSRFFKKNMHMNFKDYLNQIRINKSVQLLTSSDMSVTTIATEVGFSTSSYYIEQFKRIKETTPRKFRHQFNSLN